MTNNDGRIVSLEYKGSENCSHLSVIMTTVIHNGHTVGGIVGECVVFVIIQNIQVRPATGYH